MGVLHRDRSRRQPAVEARIREALIAMRPLLGHVSSGVELVRFEAAAGVAVLRVEGDCPDCDLTAAMLIQGIAAHLRMQVPEVLDVRPLSPDTETDG